MEALAAVSLAGNILQFLQFCADLVSESRQIYDSVEGTTKDFENLEDVCRHVSELGSVLIPPVSVDDLEAMPEHARPLKAEINMFRLAMRCKDTADELSQCLSEARVGSSAGKMDCIKQSVKNWMGKSRVKGLKKTMESCRSDLMISLTVITNHKQSGVLRHLEELQGARLNLIHDHAARLKEIEDLVKDVHSEAQMINSDKDDKQVLLNSLSTQLKTILSLSKRRWISEHKVVHSLYYESLSVRHETIPKAHSRTFSWILREKTKYRGDTKYPKVALRSWLQNGEGIYWVSGKPGSGKSTLMKFIADHPETLACLEKWAGSRECVVAAYYFWNPGTRLQKTTEGLLRSLLFDIFASHPELIPTTVPPGRWDTASHKTVSRQYRLHGDEMIPTWTMTEMLSTLRKLSNIDANMPRFCLFVDGLDEYHGDPKDIIRLIQSLACGKNFKLCVSSRPWNVFEDSLGLQESRKLYLHELTRNDIHQYISSMLQQDQSWKLEAFSDDRYKNLVEQITSKAQGVFLWVVLVVRSVLEGLGNSDSILLLEKQIEQIPKDLGPYFRQILESVEPIYHQQMALYFQVALDAANPFTLMHYSFLDDCIEYGHSSMEGAIKPMDDNDIFRRHFSMRRRLNARCKGLLEDQLKVSERTSYLAYDVNFLHRTVRDFLRTEEMRDFIMDKLGDYPVDTIVLMAYTSLIKALPRGGPSDTFFDQALTYAARAEKEMAGTAVECVDQLFRTMKFRSRSPASLNMARFTVQKGLCVCVSEYADAGLSGFDDPSQLLWLAIEASVSPEQCSADLGEMISLLLARGALLDKENLHRFLHLLSAAIGDEHDSDVALRHLRVLRQILPVVQDVNSCFNETLPWITLLENVMMGNSMSRSLTDARLSMIQVLFAHGAKPNAEYHRSGTSVWIALCNAVRGLDHSCGKAVLSINALRIPQSGALRITEHGKVLRQEMLGRTIQILVEAGADIHHPDSLTTKEISKTFNPRIAGRVNETVRRYSERRRRKTDAQPISWGTWMLSWLGTERAGEKTRVGY